MREIIEISNTKSAVDNVMDDCSQNEFATVWYSDRTRVQHTMYKSTKGIYIVLNGKRTYLYKWVDGKLMDCSTGTEFPFH